MTSHQDKEHICFSRGWWLLTDLSWHSGVTVLPKTLCYSWKHLHVGKGAKWASQILFIQRLRVSLGLCVYVCVYIYTYVSRCTCTQERDWARPKKPCWAILNVIPDELCLESDECAPFPIAFLFIFVHFSLYQEMQLKCWCWTICGSTTVSL